MREPPDRFANVATDTASSRVVIRSVSGGVIAAVLVVAAGLALLAFRSQVWTVTSSLIVLPANGQLSQSEMASYYDTLSRGQIVATFAQIIQSQSDPVREAGDLGLTGDQAERITVAVTAVPNTSIISIKVDAPAGDQAARVANEVAEAGLQTLQQLKTPYTAAVVAGPGPAKSAGPSMLTFGLVVAVVAVVAGVGAQQILWLLGLARARRRAPVTSDPSPVPDPVDIDSTGATRSR